VGFRQDTPDCYLRKRGDLRGELDKAGGKIPNSSPLMWQKRKGESDVKRERSDKMEGEEGIWLRKQNRNTQIGKGEAG